MRPFYRIVLLILILLGAEQKSAAQSETISFLHLTDTHLIFDIEDYHPGIFEKRKHYGYGITRLQHMLDSASRTKDIRFVSITGDLIDYYSAVNQAGAERNMQVERFSQLISQYSIPIYLNLGNHDIVTHGWNDKGMTSSQRIAGKSRAAWIRSAPAFRDGTYYSRNLQVGKTKYKLIFLENGYNSAGELEPTKPPYLDRVQMEWLKEQLNEASDDIEIVFMHIPFYPTSGGEFFQTLTSHPSLRLILAGHDHENRVTKPGSSGNLTQVQTGAFARDPHNWRKVQLSENSITVSKPGQAATEVTVNLTK